MNTSRRDDRAHSETERAIISFLREDVPPKNYRKNSVAIDFAIDLAARAKTPKLLAIDIRSGEPWRQMLATYKFTVLPK